MKDFSDYRKNYSKSSLLDHEIGKNPFVLFKSWLKMAEDDSQIDEPNAMTLSTVNDKNEPRNRVVLMKMLKKNGIVFFTNYESKKGDAIKKNHNVCISFFWPSLEKQIIINGICSKISKKESDDYFYSRPLDSQVGAISSDQSKEIPSREYLEKKFNEIKKNSPNLTRPNNWGGFFININEFEFWQGRSNRLHDRIVFSKSNNDSWTVKRLSP